MDESLSALWRLVIFLLLRRGAHKNQHLERAGTERRLEVKQVALGIHTNVKVNDELREKDHLLPGAANRPLDDHRRLALKTASHIAGNGVYDLDSRQFTGRLFSQPLEVPFLRPKLEGLIQPV
jgi:hypothetical protein